MGVNETQSLYALFGYLMIVMPELTKASLSQ